VPPGPQSHTSIHYSHFTGVAAFPELKLQHAASGQMVSVFLKRRLRHHNASAEVTAAGTSDPET
jgi:hypothetical protein